MSGHDVTTHGALWRARRDAAYALALGMLLSAVLWWGSPSVALAQAPSETVSAPVEGRVALPTQTMEPGLWMYLMALGCALVFGGIYLLRRARHNQHVRMMAVTADLDTLEIEREQVPAPSRDTELQALAKSLARNTSGELGALAVESELGSPLFALRSEGPQRECPKCRRRFASWMAVCPFDHVSLQEPGHSGVNVRKLAARRAKANREDMLPRKRCLLCDRRYHEDVTYCTHDGEKLIQDMREEAEEASNWRVCRCCGHDEPVGVKEFECGCGEDKEDVITINPGVMRARGLPLSKCPTCGVYGGPGQTHCATHADEVLLPESVFERHALSARGYGPLRKLCTRCHERFSGAYSFCPHDGQRLKNID